MEIALIIFEYILLIAFGAIGISLSVLEQVIKFGDRFPGKKRTEIMAEYWNNEWDTFQLSLVIQALDILFHVSIHLFYPDLRNQKIWVFNYQIIAFLAAVLIGYFGQKKVYQLLGKADKYFDKKIDEKLPS